MKNLVIEGPDGAGKTTLLSDLNSIFMDMPTHPRMSSSVGGPVENLADRVFETLDMRGRFFDRHPLISEYVYGSVLPERKVDPMFLSPVMRNWRSRFAHNSTVILCMPPFEIVKKNVLVEDQMPGVVENLSALYQAYQLQVITWPTPVIKYDYTSQSLDWLVQQIDRSNR